jgi:hypothetical protein
MWDTLKLREIWREGNGKLGCGIDFLMWKTCMQLICQFVPEKVQPGAQLMLYTPGETS